MGLAECAAMLEGQKGTGNVSSAFLPFKHCGTFCETHGLSCIWQQSSIYTTHSPITHSKLSSINLVSIFRCSSSPHNPVYVTVRRIDSSVLIISLSSHRYPPRNDIKLFLGYWLIWLCCIIGFLGLIIKAFDNQTEIWAWLSSPLIIKLFEMLDD